MAADTAAHIDAGSLVEVHTLTALPRDVAAALGWGALHALSPGHGKAMVAGYLAGSGGRPRHAVILGVTVTVTHTAAVFAFGIASRGATTLKNDK